MKPILFNTEMVRAILDGRKTVTRRVVKPQPMDTDDCQHEMQTYDQMLPQFYKGDYSCVCRKCGYGTQPDGESIFQPPYRPGETLYVRETFHQTPNGQYWYKADNLCKGCTEDGHCVPHGVEHHKTCKICEYYDGYENIKWRPSIHMPREAARIFLRVENVRMERLQDITEEQAISEGCSGVFAGVGETLGSGFEVTPTDEFSELWDSTIKPADRTLYGWEGNPWVFVISFERISRDEALQ